MRRLFATALVALLLSPIVAASDLTVVGAWVVNRELTPITSGDHRRPESERPHPGGGRGGFSGGLSGIGGGTGPSEAELHKLEAIRERLTTIPDRLIITQTPTTVTIADGLGRTVTLKTDGKKQPRLTGEGEFTSKTHFEGTKLVVEDDFGGPKVITTFEPTLERGELARLIVTVTLDNLPGGRGGHEGHGAPGAHGGPEGEHRAPDARRVYDAEPR